MINRFLENLKNNLVLRFFYKLPLAPLLYSTILAWLGSVIYHHPSQKIFVIGVTGTKGKSTVVELINHILKFAGKKTAALSSVGVEIAGKREDKPLDNTMPGRFFIQQFLHRAVKEGCQYAIIEVTSEGVKLNRHRFINWSAAILTNLALEHIEAHGSFEKYREAKLKFFRYAAKNKQCLFFIDENNKNAEHFIGAIVKRHRKAFILYGKNDLPSQLIGEFNKYNIGAAVALAQSRGVGDEIIKKAVAGFSGVPGRMEFVQKEPFAVVVDYAHTPDSLCGVYKTLRQAQGKPFGTAQGKLICVLGAAGGGRDKWKRPEMGKIAAEYCDEVILTNEDPYDENPEEILDQISSGFSQVPSSKFQISRILDRKEAIKKAISLAEAGDVVVITGKGSEKWMRLGGGKKIPWNDKETTLNILTNLGR